MYEIVIQDIFFALKTWIFCLMILKMVGGKNQLIQARINLSSLLMVFLAEHTSRIWAAALEDMWLNLAGSLWSRTIASVSSAIEWVRNPHAGVRNSGMAVLFEVTGTRPLLMASHMVTPWASCRVGISMIPCF